MGIRDRIKERRDKRLMARQEIIDTANRLYVAGDDVGSLTDRVKANLTERFSKDAPLFKLLMSLLEQLIPFILKGFLGMGG